MIAPVIETNWMTADNARKLAQKIATYWAVRGQTVQTFVEPIDGGMGGGYVIRSDMLNGMPRGQG